MRTMWSSNASQVLLGSGKFPLFIWVISTLLLPLFQQGQWNSSVPKQFTWQKKKFESKTKLESGIDFYKLKRILVNGEIKNFITQLQTQSYCRVSVTTFAYPSCIALFVDDPHRSLLAKHTSKLSVVLVWISKRIPAAALTFRQQL